MGSIGSVETVRQWRDGFFMVGALDAIRFIAQAPRAPSTQEGPQPPLGALGYTKPKGQVNLAGAGPASQGAMGTVTGTTPVRSTRAGARAVSSRDTPLWITGGPGAQGGSGSPGRQGVR